MKKVISLLLVICLACTLLVGCGQSGEETAAEATPGETGEYVDGFEFKYAGDQPNTLNLTVASSNMDLNTLGILEAGLFRNVGGEYINDICESYTLSEDNLTYTFKLRDAIWSDDVKVTADQFEYSLKTFLDPNSASPYSMFYTVIKNGASYHDGSLTDWDEVGVECPDDNTLVVTLEYPYPALIAMITDDGLFPLRQDVVESFGENYGTSPETLAYCGPYTLESWDVTHSITFVKNEKYWNSENSYFAGKITNEFVSDKGTAFAMYENGEFDCLHAVDADYMSLLPENEAYPYYSGMSCVLLLNENGTTPENGELLSNNNFRLALSYAIDRETYCTVKEGEESPISRLIPSQFKDANGTPVADTFDVFSVPLNGDVAKAQEYLNKALEELGYASAADLPELQFVTYESQTLKPFMELLIDEWKQNLGITNISFTQLPIGSAIGQYYQSAYDIFYFTFAYGVSEYETLSYFTTGMDGNMGIWYNEEYNTLFEQIKRTQDDSERYALLQQAEEIFNNECPIIPLSERMTTAAVKSEFVGANFTPGNAQGEFMNLRKLAQ